MVARIFSQTTAVALSMVTSVSAFAGWTSGGGELVRDARNPWFLKNTKIVHYCVEIDEANFGQTKSRSEYVVAKAIERWKEEFRDSLPMPIGDSASPKFEIATQDFQQVDCSNSVDLRFQFGILSGEQIARLGDPKKLIGVAVRTDYDRVQMRGKGFVYIAPSRGPLRFEGKGLDENPWALEDGAILYAIVLHELGHVFGLQHSSVGLDLMNERFPELMVRKWNGANSMFKDFPRPWLFRFPDNEPTFANAGYCAPVAKSVQSNEFRKFKKYRSEKMWEHLPVRFFGIPADVDCIQLSIAKGELTIESIEIDGGPKRVVGKAKLARHDAGSNREPALWIYMPDEQQVFPGYSGGLTHGPHKQARSYFKGTYVDTSGKVKRDIVVTVDTANNFQFSGTLDGKLVINVFDGI